VPNIIALVQEVEVMGGAFGHKDHTGNVSLCAEANIIGDSHAADLVLHNIGPSQQWV
jgi:inosine-uridine nucleoside N-ribohydrolase